ncbi:MAG TPA: cobalt-precorrin-5B (C(1))-methyltransferase CbiD [Candidatus Wujingus californicus]|uniref:cobalt-precorrin-5B (C(1))-methyltransferase CbiD n=2 Tax=Candidatus Wujingus californicus TaxID=3367618 RepID=UPI004025224B
MRFGYTTGSCATAAAKAAAIGLFTGNIPDEVEIDTPGGVKLKLMILHKRLSDSFSECAVQKDAGDDPDVTNGCEVFARVEKKDIDIVEIDGGEGVGRVTKPGLQVPVGKAAINPVPRRMIENAVRLVAGEGVGVRVVVSVPRGNKLSKRTFNPRLGIIGGISIIGTIGLVRPMSEDAFKTSLLCGLDIAKGSGFETVVLVPGSLGERSILNLFDVQKDQVIQMSNFVGFMLVEAQKRGFKKIIVAGHPGKLIKLLRGDFQTHSSVSKPANDILLDIIEQHYCKQITTPLSPPSQGGDFVVSAQSNDEGEVADEIFNNLKGISTIEGMVEILRDYGGLFILNYVANKIESTILKFLQCKLEAGVILFDMKGSIVGISNNAKTWLEAIKTK